VDISDGTISTPLVDNPLDIPRFILFTVALKIKL
jgi:hypothetical protein